MEAQDFYFKVFFDAEYQAINGIENITLLEASVEGMKIKEVYKGTTPGFKLTGLGDELTFKFHPSKTSSDTIAYDVEWSSNKAGWLQGCLKAFDF